MQKFCSICGLIAIVSILGGCNSFLPDGEPPKGQITNPKITQTALDWPAACNYMITSFSSYCIGHFPQGLTLLFAMQSKNPKHTAWAEQVVRETNKIVPLNVVDEPPAKYFLVSRFDDKKEKVWTMSLIRAEDKQLLWKRKILVAVLP